MVKIYYGGDVVVVLTVVLVFAVVLVVVFAVVMLKAVDCENGFLVSGQRMAPPRRERSTEDFFLKGSAFFHLFGIQMGG